MSLFARIWARIRPVFDYPDDNPPTVIARGPCVIGGLDRHHMRECRRVIDTMKAWGAPPEVTQRELIRRGLIPDVRIKRA